MRVIAAVALSGLREENPIGPLDSSRMTTFLFWNLNRRDLAHLVNQVVYENEVDVLILAECEVPSNKVLSSLNGNRKHEFHFPTSLCERVRIFTRFSRRFIRPLYETDRLTIRRLRLPATPEILLAAVHLPSKALLLEREPGF